MEATPKVHRHRHRRSDSRHQHRQHDSTRQLNNTTAATNNVVVANTTMVQRNHNNDIENSTPLAREQGALNLVASEEAAAAAIAAVAAAVASQSGGGGSRGNREGAGRDSIISAEEGCAVSVSSALIASATAETTSFAHQNERQNSSDSMDTTLATTTTTTTSQLSQQTVLLVNGQAPPQDSANYDETDGAATLALALDVTEETTTTTSTTAAATLCKTTNDDDDDDNNDVDDVTRVVPAIAPHLESPTQQNAPSSRNSSGDALSLRETLQQLPPTVGTHHHRHRRTHSPQSPSSSRRAQQETTADASFHRGILGFIDRELKHSSPTPSALSVGSGSAGAASGSGGIGGVSGVSGSGTTRKLQSLSDPQASPAQRSIRSRSSLEKSPRRKRSKSESRRRRERKLIAAGEMEVRQANETLMRYLKQCSEMNDASLSGELEIDQNYDERRVHRKTKSQRDKRGHLISKLYTAGGLSSILKELSDDIVPADGEEIYNPFTPVVSPTEEDTPAHIDKMFLQTSSGYRPVERCYYKHSFVGASGRRVGGHHAGIAGGVGEVERGGGAASTSNVGFMRTSGSYGDTRCLLDAECGSFEITTNIQLACVIQRIWLLISNICHGLLAGLALAHLLFVLSSHPVDWSRIINHISLAGETTLQRANEAADISSIDSSSASLMDSTKLAAPTVSAAQQQSTTVIEDYATFAEIYLNTFYCLAIVCLVSIFDRMDICRWDLSNATELISFRWLIIAMIYIATIILTICSDSIDQRLYYNNNANITITQDEWFSNSVMSVWSSLAVTRSIGAICGWIMIGLTPHEDLLYEYLVDLTKYQLTNN